MTGQAVELDEPFSTLLRRATAEHHDRAESAPFVGALLGGRLTLDALAALAGQNQFIYAALESAAERWRDDPVAGPFVIDGLDRLPALRADLDQLIGPDWPSSVTALPVTRAYADRIAGADTAGAVRGPSLHPLSRRRLRWSGDRVDDAAAAR